MSFEQRSEIIETIYFGGGTPSVLTTAEINFLIDAVYQNYTVSENMEITSKPILMICLLKNTRNLQFPNQPLKHRSSVVFWRRFENDESSTQYRRSYKMS